jgi:flagellar protein FliO/FliZ
MFYSVDPVRVLVAFVAIIALMAGFVYLLHWFRARGLGASAAGRSRQPRLAVIDAASVDARRRLVLIRRDNVEHLIMIGGPTDVLIEPNIVRAIPAAPVREVTPARAADSLPRAVPLAEGGMWPLQPEPMPRAPRAAPPPVPPQEEEQEVGWSVQPEPAPRSVPEREPRMVAEREPRLAVEREPRIAAEREPRVAAEREPRVAAEREPRVAAEREPRVAAEREPGVAAEREPRAAPASPARAAPENPARVQNSERLAGLAADLSRSFLDPDAPPPPPRRSAEQRRPPPAPAQPAVSESEEHNLAEMAQRLESALQRPRPVPEPAIAAPTPRLVELPRAEPAAPPPRAEAKPSAKPAAKPGFDNLEQEMASLLGRPSGKS